MKVVARFAGFETYRVVDGVMFCRASDGVEWYDIAKLQAEEQALHLLINGDGMICSLDHDLTRMYPAGFDLVSILEDDSEQPKIGDFVEIKGNELTVVMPPRHILEARAESMRQKRLSTIQEKISPLEDAEKLGIISDSERASLTALQLYRVALYRLPQSAGWPTDVIWPDAPR